MSIGRRTSLSTFALGVSATIAVANAYQLLLLVAAALPRREAPRDVGAPMRFVVLIPAHDEAELLPHTLAEIAAQDYPPELVEVVVVADNCTDGTAQVARAAGARVLERNDPSRHGKSWALAWAMPQVADSCDAVLVLDADCVPSANLLAAAAARLQAGADAVQSDDVVGNPEASAAAALRTASFALLARVRALGKDRLGLSCGLFGTGMGFRREIVNRHAWDGAALDDGLDHHLRLVDAGVRVVFMPEAHVASSMPASTAVSLEQQRRWEAGKLQALRHWFPRLVRRGIRERDPARLVAAFDQLMPAQSALAVLNGGALVASSLRGTRGPLLLAWANAAAQAVFVLGGLRVAQAPRAVYPALLLAPVLVVQKLAIYARFAAGRPVTWVATDRRQ